MGKHYTFEIKLTIVQEYLNGSLIERWVNQYLEFEPEVLENKHQTK